MASEDEKTQPGATPRPALPPVPERYVGLWQRLILQNDGVPADVTSNAFWLQTRSWHACIRVPAARPDFSGHGSLQDCDRERLLWLADQGGGAGLTEVEGEVCTREHRVQFQPHGGTRDLARMVFVDRDTIVETGIESHYLRIWERVPGGEGLSVVLQRDGASTTPAAEWLMFAGEYGMHVRSRARGSLPAAQSLAALHANEGGDEAGLRALVDFDVSFARQTPAGWRIQLSTLPFQEGDILLAQEQLSVPRDGQLVLGGARRSRWQSLEWSDPDA